MSTQNLLKISAFPILGAATGWAAWAHGVSALSLAIAIPVLWAAAPTRWTAGAAVLGYYLAASRGVPAGSAVFWSGSISPVLLGITIWVGVSAVLTGPWGALWSPRYGWTWRWRFPLVLVIVYGGLGYIGWASPLTAAGVLFPGLGALGLVLTAILQMLLVDAPLTGATDRRDPGRGCIH